MKCNDIEHPTVVLTKARSRAYTLSRFSLIKKLNIKTICFSFPQASHTLSSIHYVCKRLVWTSLRLSVTYEERVDKYDIFKINLSNMANRKSHNKCLYILSHH